MTNSEDLVGLGIDVQRESILTFGQAARYVGKLKAEKPVALQTLFRWSTKGRRGVLLERIYIGGTPCTSKEALQRFFDGVTSAVGVGGCATVPVGLVDRLADQVGDVDGVLRQAGITDPGSD